MKFTWLWPNSCRTGPIRKRNIVDWDQ